VHLDEVAYNGQSYPEPSVLSREGAVSLPESIKYEREELFSDAFPAVGDGYAGA
jgi:hypothetical protein